MSDIGIARNEIATEEHQIRWDSIVVAPEKKAKLINWGVLALHLRSVLPRTETAVGGLALLYGPPGTGKTTLALGLAGPLRKFVKGNIRVIEIDAHSLMSAEHGQSQRAASQLLAETLPALSRDENPTVVVLDEVESLAVARSEANLDANPVDVHRTTDAVLAALDLVADICPNVIIVATTNFQVTVDEALRSRADVRVEIPSPDAAAIELILRATLTTYAKAFPELKAIAENPTIAEVAQGLLGRDARQVRKFIADTLATDMRLAAAPDTLSIQDLLSNLDESP